MSEILVYFLKVNFSVALFCLGYYLILRRLTFYSINRIYCLFSLIFSIAYPYFNLADHFKQSNDLAKPIHGVIINWQKPAIELAQAAPQTNHWNQIETLFWAIVILLACRLCFKLISLYSIHRKSIPGQINQKTVRILTGDHPSFSFWKSIYVNPVNKSDEDIGVILLHEQVHINNLHTADILLAELCCILNWFNPGIWLLKKAIMENLEYIADREVLITGTDSKAYQYSLIKAIRASSSLTIVAHFNFSTIKKRIVMINSKNTSPINVARYVLLLPAIFALLLIFTSSNAASESRFTKSFINVIRPVSVSKIAEKKMPNESSIHSKGKYKPYRLSENKKEHLKQNVAAPENIVYFLNGDFVDIKKTDLIHNTIDGVYLLKPQAAANFITYKFKEGDVAFFFITAGSEKGARLKQLFDQGKFLNNTRLVNRFNAVFKQVAEDQKNFPNESTFENKY